MLRGLLKTSRVMSRECAAIGQAAAGRASTDAGRGPGVDSAARMFVASYAAPPPPPPSRTKWTRLVHPSVLIGHVSSLSPWYGEELREAVGLGGSAAGSSRRQRRRGQEGVRLLSRRARRCRGTWSCGARNPPPPSY